MLEEDKNIKDSQNQTSLSVKDTGFPISPNRINKLITALYMVTDIIDTGEPLRAKLRTLGAEIISDVQMAQRIPTGHTVSLMLEKVQEIISFLNIASAINLISQMNSNILNKEFLRLEESIKEYSQSKLVWLEDFSMNSGDDDAVDDATALSPRVNFPKNSRKQFSIGHHKYLKPTPSRTRIGVQKGGTLMKALSDKTSFLSSNVSSVNFDFNILKKQRREDIIRIIKTSEVGMTITDIKVTAKGLTVKAETIISCSEKTLQRELMSMVKDGVLNKIGEKRWSKYFIK
jgi:hypothetical protein